jgi:flap endonuclease-1
MGVKGLYTYVKQYRAFIDPRTSPPKRIGIDAMSLLYKHKAHTENILILLHALKQAGHRIIFVFDGKPPTEKEREVQTRKDQKSAAGTKVASLQAFLSSDAAAALDIAARDFLEYSLERLQRQSWHMTRELRRNFQGELWKAEIPYVKSVSEADDVLVDMAQGGKLDVILSTDMDYLLSGVQRLWVPTHRGLFHYEELCLDTILEGEGISVQSLVDAGLLCGTEEREKARGIQCARAFTLIRHYGSLENVLNSNVKDTVIREMFPDREAIAAARKRLIPKAPYERIRPDHLERVKDFLDAL